MTTTREDHVLDAEGHFHTVDEPIDLSGYGWEDWLVLGVFWLLALDIFYQFFTRYVLESSAAWTEEIARYLLIIVTLVGAAMAVRRTRTSTSSSSIAGCPRRLRARCPRSSTLHARPSSATAPGSRSSWCRGCTT
jgi:hypothetical protein